MKRFIVCLLAVCSLASVACAGLQIPNLEATAIYDFASHQSYAAVTSKLFTLEPLELRVGYSQPGDDNIVLGALCMDISKLPKVHYAWEGILKTTVGIWGGYNGQAKKAAYGVSVIVVDIEFK